MPRNAPWATARAPTRTRRASLGSSFRRGFGAHSCRDGIRGAGDVERRGRRNARGARQAGGRGAGARPPPGSACGAPPPLGHAVPLRTVVDPTLLEFDEVWAAAGTPDSVFPVAPKALVKATAGAVVAVTH